ncbi:MAG: hypothetical protein Q9181_001747 [Wetmoreana brouardii]
MSHAGKRKASEDASGNRSSARIRGNQPDIDLTFDSIDTLDPMPFEFAGGELRPEDLAAAFPGLSIGQQQVNLWVVFTSRYGDEIEAVYDFWKKERGITPEDLTEWNHGKEVKTVINQKHPGAKVATRMIKRLQQLANEVNAHTTRRALLFMYAKFRDVINVMIPNHHEMLADVIGSIQSLCGLSNTTTQVVPMPAGGGSTQTDFDQMVLGFQEELAPSSMPQIVGKEETIDALEELLELPRLFAHLLTPRSMVGFQGIMLFGPPGTGETLLAQTLAAKQDLTFFNVPADQLMSEWVGETEK